ALRRMKFEQTRFPAPDIGGIGGKNRASLSGTDERDLPRIVFRRVGDKGCVTGDTRLAEWQRQIRINGSQPVVDVDGAFGLARFAITEQAEELSVDYGERRAEGLPRKI